MHPEVTSPTAGSCPICGMPLEPVGGAGDDQNGNDFQRRLAASVVPAVIVTGRVAVMGTVPMPPRCTLLGKPVPLASLVATLLRIAPRAEAVRYP